MAEPSDAPAKAHESLPSVRQEALDALRGWAILGMALSGLLPWGSLPAWMYHAQLPPPEMKFDPSVSGITWVDLVFPFFIFAMGAAIPFAMGRKLDQGQPWWETIEGLGRRFLLLLAFAFLVQATRPSSLPDPGTGGTQLAGLGFFAGILFIYGVHPSLPKWSLVPLRITGLAALTACAWPLILGDKLSLLNQDIIIRVLAAVSFTGGLIHWGMRSWKSLPLASFGLVLIWFVLTKTWPPLQSTLEWTFHPLFTRLEYQKYLLVLIPGLLYGQWLLTRKEDTGIGWKENEPWLAAVLPAFIPAALLMAGGSAELVLAAGALVAGLCLLWMSRFRMCRGLVLSFALLLLAAGLGVSGLGEGIRKDSATGSYFLATSGLAVLLHQGIELWRRLMPRDSPGFVALIGSNPLLAYALITHFIFTAVRLTGIHGWVGAQGWSPWGLAGYALAQTMFIGLLAAAAAKLKLQMKA